MNDKAELLKKFNNSKLIDIAKNYKQYGYEERIRDAAISILSERGIKEEDFILTGIGKNYKFESASDLFVSYNKNSKIAYSLYAFLIISYLLAAILTGSREIISLIFSILMIISFITYTIFLIRSFINQNDFYKVIGKEMGSGDQLVYIIIGMPFFIFIYLYYKSKMKEELKFMD